ncbi:MAG: helix-turn-helix transcriptional regulator, partial [Bacteroidota bacterium]
MKEHALGEFEEVVMLTIGVLFDEAYGVAIKDEIEDRLNRKVSVGAMQSALRRLEQKGYLSSRRGETDPTRGGKPKRYFTITASGARALNHAREVRNELWNAIPKI